MSPKSFLAAAFAHIRSGSELRRRHEELTRLHDETRAAYENLRSAQEQLLQTEKMAALGQLIAGVAHELNNPLTAILGYSQLLADGHEVTPRGADYVDKLYKQALRTHRIVQNLLSFARKRPPERLLVNLNHVVEGTLALREYHLRVSNIHVHRDLAPNLPFVSGDPHQLQQVFLNILNNAVDAVLERSARSEIWVRTWADAGSLHVEFVDSGPGVRKAARVFDPFYTTKPVGKGTGLGLSICYGLVKEHGGGITVRNVPPRGAAFCISLPSAGQAQPSPQVSPAADDAPLSARILLVDDEESVLDLEKEVLRKRCPLARTARSGREAIRLLERESLDLVVTDLNMPGDVSGGDLYRWIESHRPELASRVIFTISNAGDEAARAFLTRTGCPFIQKPFKLDEFLRLLRQVLARPAPAGVPC